MVFETKIYGKELIINQANNSNLVFIFYDMREYLKWWTLLPNETKKQIMQSNNITKILYADIKRLYLEGRK